VTYALIAEDGTLRIEAGVPSIEKITELVGPEGWARVYPHREFRATAWVNDCGLILPDQYARNVVGACVIASMGASTQPYAGPMVITGYAFDEGGWPGDLPTTTIAAVRDIHTAVTAILAGKLTETPPWADPQWPAEIAGLAEAVRTGETPGWTVHP
jgi:hypothetical protein